MESVLGIIFSAENVRMLVLLVFGFSCFIWMKTSFRNDLLNEIDKKINVFHNQLKVNEFAHLNNKIEALTSQLNGRMDSLTLQVNSRMDALTFVLEKNGSLKKEDKEYIDGKL
jgi:hypothetical protein